MKNLKSFLLAAAVVLTTISFSACSTGQGGQTGSQSISLSADPSSVFVDQSSTFTVVDNSTREDITSEATVYIVSDDGSQPLDSKTFSSSLPGTFTFYAEYNGIRSSEITIVVSAESAEGITLSASKNQIYNDGGDFSVLTLTDAEGNDVTSLGTFYANNEPVEGNLFKSTGEGSYTIMAMYGSEAVEKTVRIRVSSSYSFTGRVLLEDITSTNCQNCPYIIQVVDEVSKDEPQLVVAYSIHCDRATTPARTSATDGYMRSYIDMMNEKKVANGENEEDYGTAPITYIDRGQKASNGNIKWAADTPNFSSVLRSMAANASRDVAIAIDSESDVETVSADITVGTKKNFSGKVVAVLVENGIMANQSWFSESRNIELFRVMRAYWPSVEGQPASFTEGTPSHFTATFNLSDLGVRNIANCEIVAFVTDDADGLCEVAQVAKVGAAKGY